MELKTCRTCGVEKELSSFYQNSRYPDGHFKDCRSCHRVKNEEWIRNNPEKVKEIQKRSREKNGRKFYLNQMEKRKKDWVRYSNQRKEWDKNRQRKRYALAKELEISQKGRCGICSKSFIERYDIDHSHETGLIRGLLCRKCNSGLHYFEDNEFIKKATQYLIEYPASQFPPTKY